MARVRKGRIKVAQGVVEECDAVISAPPATLAAVVYGGAPLESVKVEGDRQLAERFVKLFPLPAKVGADLA